MEPSRVVVLADDLTSAADGAVPFRRSGHRALVLFDPPEPPGAGAAATGVTAPRITATGVTDTRITATGARPPVPRPPVSRPSTSAPGSWTRPRRPPG